jgi:SAM-dependent methyltransferase
VIDIGGGAGTQSLPLARRGHPVTIVDPSAAMLDRARRALAAEPSAVAERVELIEAPGEQARAAVGDAHFAAVLCHGVIPYVTEPGPFVAVLCALARPGGIVSILAKNAQTMAVGPALNGRWRDALRAFDASEEINALGLRTRADTVDDLTALLSAHGVHREAWYGVRVFAETVPPDRTAGDAELDEIVAVEHEASRRDPYRQLSRLFHLVGRRAGDA